MRRAPLLLLLWASLASAEPTRWYGWQIMIPDAVFSGVFLATAPGDDPSVPAILVATTGLLLDGPIVHMAHRRWSRAGWSGGMRVAAAGLALVIARDCCEDNPTRGQVATFLVPMLIAQVVDAALLAREPAPPPREIAWLPAPYLSSGGAGLAWRGSF